MSPSQKKVYNFPVIPLRDTVLFPGTLTPLLLGRPQTLAAMFKALDTPSQSIFFALQKNAEKEELQPDDIYDVGVIGKVKLSNPSSGNLTKIVVNPSYIARSIKWEGHPTFLEAWVEPLDIKPSRLNQNKLRQELLTLFEHYIQQHPDIPMQLTQIAEAQTSLEDLIYTIASQMKTATILKQDLLTENSILTKCTLLTEFLNNEMNMAVYARQLDHEVKTNIAKTQKEYFLNEQLNKIKIELGHYSSHLNPENKKLNDEFKAKGMPPKIFDKALAEIKRLELLPSSSPEHSVIRNYLDWLGALPWKTITTDVTQLKKVKAQLDKDHFGLDKIKNRILEHVAVHQLSKSNKGPILCFAGPPGVGKTSLGKSIADSLGRKFVRISLGGIRDEAEIRGHRRTYVGAMPGRIIQAIKRSGSMNPVILLDEIDKMSGDFRGDPASAMLEVLDPEQNNEFSDHFMEVEIDISRVLFITTANVENNIPEPLKDRMEVIRLSGYYQHEKVEIAKKHLLPKIITACGIQKKHLTLSDSLLKKIVSQYTYEAGVRNLEKTIFTIGRKIARKVLESPKSFKGITEKNLSTYLGAPLKRDHSVPKKNPPGVLTGLAWTPYGGEVLHIECKLLSGKGNFRITGKLGDVMKESIQIALTLVRERLKNFKIDPAIVKSTDIHVHVPEGAIPKDGPSAGMPLTLALLSAFTRQAIPPYYAFTGEISLTGKIHAIGGLPEKSLAAIQAGVSEIFIPEDNSPDVLELPKEAKKGLKINTINHIDKVIKKLFKRP